MVYTSAIQGCCMSLTQYLADSITCSSSNAIFKASSVYFVWYSTLDSLFLDSTNKPVSTTCPGVHVFTQNYSGLINIWVWWHVWDWICLPDGSMNWTRNFEQRTLINNDSVLLRVSLPQEIGILRTSLAWPGRRSEYTWQSHTWSKRQPVYCWSLESKLIVEKNVLPEELLILDPVRNCWIKQSTTSKNELSHDESFTFTPNVMTHVV